MNTIKNRSMETQTRSLYQITDQQFKNIKESHSRLIENGKDFYCETGYYEGFITNISYLKNPIGWLVYVEVERR